MAPAALDIRRQPPPERPPFSDSPPRIVIIGGGNRGIVYSKAIRNSTNGVLVGIVEPVAVKRRYIGRHFIWGTGPPSEGQSFEHWQDYINWEQKRRQRAAVVGVKDSVPEGADAVFVCVQDQMHREVVEALAPLHLHIMCEKPLAPTLADCIAIYKTLHTQQKQQPTLFSIGHVLRYSPHNMLLRQLLVDERVIGEVMAVNHTEPVGWNHFAHSFVRGNWRRQSTSAPALLAKSCHDMDILYWLLGATGKGPDDQPHVPRDISSAGSLQHFLRSRKPVEAGTATNCLSCTAESSCQFSARRIYTSSQMAGRNQTNWSRIVCPELEECAAAGGVAAGEAALMSRLAEDYDAETMPDSDVAARSWYGRCVYEADNDVCDNQTVTLRWEDEESDEKTKNPGRYAKTATLHMVAFTKKICTRFTHIYGVDGEIYTDSTAITVQDFRNGRTEVHYPYVPAEGGHGDGDEGLSRAFVLAVDRVKNGGMSVADAQRQYIGCSLADIIMSHGMVFAAEEARLGRKVVDFPAWWQREVMTKIGKS